MAIVLNDVVSNNNTSVMNANFAKIEDAINNDLLKREIEVGEANEMRTHLDMNANKQVNLLDGVDPNDAATVGQMEAFQDTISDGEDGSDGATGDTGAPGAKGDTGDTGAPGADGEDGVDGTGSGIVLSVVAGTNVTVDDTDPANPIVSATGGTSSPLTTKGDVYTYDTAEQRLAVGTDGQVLTADSAEATGVKWETPTAGGGGALEKLSSNTVVTPGDDFMVVAIPLGYENFDLRVTGKIGPSNASVLLRVSDDGASTFKAGASDYKTSVANSASSISLSDGNTLGAARPVLYSGSFNTDDTGATRFIIVGSLFSSGSTGTQVTVTASGYYQTDAIITHFRVELSAGDMDDMEVTLWGRP